MKWLVATAFILVPYSAYAAFWTGNDVFKACNNDKQFVVGYVTGWAEKHGIDDKAIKEHVIVLLGEDSTKAVDSGLTAGIAIRGGVCFPEKVTAGQMADVFCKALNDQPEHRHFSAESLLRVALEKAFPCD